MKHTSAIAVIVLSILAGAAGFSDALARAPVAASQPPLRINASQLADQAVAAAVNELNLWFKAVRINPKRCIINGAVATAGPGVLVNRAWLGMLKQQLIASGVDRNTAARWDAAFKKSFTDWARLATIPGLTLYPGLAAYAGPVAPPTANVPVSLERLRSANAREMTAERLECGIKAALGARVNPVISRAAADFSTRIGDKFSRFLKTASVTKLMGKGPVPGYVRGRTPVGPVTGGTCFSPGTFIKGSL